MLNKKICMKCSKTHWPAFWGEFSGSKLNKAWDRIDEENWKYRKEIICPHDSGEDEFAIAKTDQAPPKWCPYKFEHAVAEGSKRVK